MSKKHTFEDNQALVFYALNLVGYRWQDIWSREEMQSIALFAGWKAICLLYTSPSPRDKRQSRMPSSA